jgi:hypothetical protein
MGRLSAPLLTLALVAFAALGLLACGNDDSADLLPGGTASEINSNLDQVQALVAEGECIGAEEAAQQVSDQVEALGGVDQQLKQALREGAVRLTAVVTECEEAPEEETEPAIEPAVEPEEDEEKPVKPPKAKPDQKGEGAPEEDGTSPSLPPQAEGKAKGHEKQEEAPPAEPGSGAPSGGIGPGEPAEGEG